MSVFVLDRRKKPLMPCSEKRARKLLASGNFNIQTSDGVVQGISHRYCTVIQRADGYGYSWLKTKASTATRSLIYLPTLNGGVSRRNK